MRAASAAIESGLPAQEAAPKYRLKFQTRSRHIDASIPSDARATCSFAVVAQVRSLPQRASVFNIEVHGHHVYHITEDSILDHNNSSVSGNAPKGAFGNRSVGAAETPLARYFENEVIERMNGQFPTSESWELISLTKPQAMSETDYLIGPNQKRYYARFYDHMDESYINISINYDPITGELGIIKKSSRQ